MLDIARDDRAAEETLALRAMFRARKHVFIDLLGWDLDTVAGEFEIDQFDGAAADYLILSDRDGAHRASARLLRTDRDHLLGSIYPHLCAGPVPTGPTIREITRFCLDRRQRSAERRSARNQLVSALADHATSTGISAYTGVAETDWFEQVRSFGWSCEALGQPVRHGTAWLTALHIAIEQDTIARLASRGTYQQPHLVLRLSTFGALGDHAGV